MALSTKIHYTLWSDDDVGRLEPLEKLAFVWLLTNRDINNVGFQKVSRRQFEFDTRCPLKVLEGACKGLTRALHFEESEGGLMVLAKNYVKHQFGDRNLNDKNRIVKHLVGLIAQLPEDMQDLILERYPDLRSPFKPLQAPCMVLISPLKGDISPLKGPEQSRAEQSRADRKGIPGKPIRWPRTGMGRCGGTWRVSACGT